MIVQREKGFTLLEVMVALGILASGLAALAHSQSLSLRAVSRAKMITLATQLARQRMVEIEDELQEEGFSEFEEQEESGDFSDDGWASIKWHSKVEKIELPGSVDMQSAMSSSQGSTGGASATGAQAAGGAFAETMGAAASAVAGSFDLIREVLESSIRKVTLTVEWKEGLIEQSLSVQAYLTDPKRIDMAGMVPPASASGPMGTGAPER